MLIQRTQWKPHVKLIFIIIAKICKEKKILLYKDNEGHHWSVSCSSLCVCVLLLLILEMQLQASFQLFSW